MDFTRSWAVESRDTLEVNWKKNHCGHMVVTNVEMHKSTLAYYSPPTFAPGRYSGHSGTFSSYITIES
jgi:hypothetical protein